jgi:hypothetical protein
VRRSVLPRRTGRRSYGWLSEKLRTALGVELADELPDFFNDATGIRPRRMMILSNLPTAQHTRRAVPAGVARFNVCGMMARVEQHRERTMEVRGEEVSFELSSADSSTAAPVVIYSNGGGALARPVRVLGAKERLVVTDVHVTGKVAVDGSFYDGSGASPGAGELITAFVITTSSGGFVTNLSTPHYCQVGKTPLVKNSAAGQYTLTGKGFILKA